MHNLVPRFLLDNYKLEQYNGQFPAVGLFVDITGFSQLTDDLLEYGQHGAEVLAGVMRQIFTPLIAIVYAQGGFVSSLAGDAFTAIFPLQSNQAGACLKALAAAKEIQNQLTLIGS